MNEKEGRWGEREGGVDEGVVDQGRSGWSQCIQVFSVDMKQEAAVATMAGPNLSSLCHRQVRGEGGMGSLHDLNNLQ